MGKATAFCPSYVTGVFTIESGDAAGAGFSIDMGMTTTATESSGAPAIEINGKKEDAPVSRAVLKRYEEIAGKAAVSVSHLTDLPIGFGMGMSAAGAVSLSLALNELMGSGLSMQRCVRIAHDAEVECGTGLSGADAAAIGGFLARRSVEHPPVKLPFEEKEMHFAFFSAIETASIISDPQWKKKVNAAGSHALECLFSDQSWESFVGCSRGFAEDSGLAKWCAKEMKANARASMAMVGRTLFSDSPLKLEGKGFTLMKAQASQRGAELI